MSSISNIDQSPVGTVELQFTEIEWLCHVFLVRIRFIKVCLNIMFCTQKTTKTLGEGEWRKSEINVFNYFDVRMCTYTFSFVDAISNLLKVLK